MITVNENDAQTQLPKLLSLVSEGKEVVVISSNDKPLAKIIPFSAPKKDRTPGLSKGMIQVSSDFDEPLSDDFWAGTE